MRRVGHLVTAAALLLAGLFAFAAPALPFPVLAARALAGLFLLAAITRLSAELGLRGQGHTRHAVAGVALSAAVWFVAGAVGFAQPGLVGLAALHILAAGLALWPLAHPPRANEPELSWERAIRVAGGTGAAMSMVAIASLPRALEAGGPLWVPAAVAATLLLSAWLQSGTLAGTSVAAVASVFALVVAAHTLGRLGSEEAVELLGPGAKVAPAFALTAALGAAPAIVAMTGALPALWALMAPRSSRQARTALAWATLPVIAGVALLVV